MTPQQSEKCSCIFIENKIATLKDDTDFDKAQYVLCSKDG